MKTKYAYLLLATLCLGLHSCNRSSQLHGPMKFKNQAPSKWL